MVQRLTSVIFSSLQKHAYENANEWKWLRKGVNQKIFCV